MSILINLIFMLLSFVTLMVIGRELRKLATHLSRVSSHDTANFITTLMATLAFSMVMTIAVILFIMTNVVHIGHGIDLY